MHDQYVIGIDVGTSSSKAVSYTLDGQVLASGRSSYESDRVRGGVRQRPSDWADAAISALRAAVVPEAQCLGIALGGQLGTYVALDANLDPIEDAWTWQDGQPAAVLSAVAESIDLDEVAAELTTWLPHGPNWPLPRLLWLREHRPATFARLHGLAMPKDYVLFRLTGRFVTDASSWRGLVSPDGAIHEAALAAIDVPDVVAPRSRTTDVADVLRPELAHSVGLAPGVPVFVGTGDFACALLGSGIVDEGDSFDVGGTSEHLGTLSAERRFDVHQTVVPYLEASSPDLFVNYGVSSNGGSITDWLGSTLLPHLEPSDRGTALASIAESASPSRHPLVFVPYISGERSPIWDSNASGAWIGLRADHGPADLVRAALEGVAFNLRHIRDINPLMTEGELIRACGGTARSAVWNQIKADVLASPLAVVEHTDAGTLGAAIHAAAGSGVFGSPAAAARHMTRITTVWEPQSEAVARYDDTYHHYRELASHFSHVTHPGGNQS